ncbi:glycosyltransferase family 4 protein [Bradyrhizobium sp. 30]|uniref:glycosyltransferase family 4 protein n=1 Tax=Bradyrhizobium sp. 30 TaxID=2782669 RepID=UPI001FF94411|nr:glycosyltransferase family 4 protein [Bradyrhizobium sp. 30]MCK1295192.1 glycosyltransferase family 4 protein [Bradyrhizobium sp. 30]
MTSSSQSDFSSRGRVALWAQRNSWRLPRAVRRAAKELMIRGELARADDGLIDDWAKPLVPYDSEAEPSAPDEPPSIPTGALLSSAERHVPSDCVHCLIVTPVLDAGGIDEFVAFLARRLPALAFRVTVMCANTTSPSYVGQLSETLQKEGTTVLVTSPIDGCQWLRANRPDVISAHDPPMWILEAAADARIPVVETLHGIPTPISTDWKHESRRSKFITSFVAVSDFVRRQYLAGNPSFPGHAITTIPNAFNDTHRPLGDRSRARAWLGLKEEFLFLTLGRHTVQKNSYGLVDAFAEVARINPNVHLLIAGRLDDVMYTRQVCVLRDKLPSRARIHLRHSFANPSTLLAAADSFVLNSFFEGWSLACMEALSAGLPVVISEVGGAREQVGTDGSRGFVVANPLGSPEKANWETAGLMRFRPQPNKSELVCAMNAIVAQRHEWSAIRCRLSDSFNEQFNANSCAKRHAEVLLHATLPVCSTKN